MLKYKKMKNSIYLEIDLDNTPRLSFSKPETFEEPKNPEEARAMIINDISLVCDALCTLISIADQNGYASKEDLVKTSNKYLLELLENAKNHNESNQE